MDLFDKAMKEYNQTNPASSKSKEKTLDAKNFYDAMTTYVNSKKPKKICPHERTFYWHGWRACVECGLCIHQVFCQNPYSQVAGYITKPKEESFPKIRKTMIDAINSVTQKKIMLNGMLGWDGPLEDGLPFELFDHLRELCLKCMDLELNKNVKCHRRSMCAAILWEKVKSLYPDAMTLTEFSEKVGVSVPTIIKSRKTIKY